jgi:catechol 2,3-dioxygenase-like lactoylglutathione lyase family enzyme
VTPPRVTQLLETALYTDDLARAADFYRNLFGFATLVESPRIVALDVVGRDVLLLFKRGATLRPLESAGGTVPPHDGSGPTHLARGLERGELDERATRLSALGVGIESRVEWDLGGVSLYFRDPDGHSVELATRGTWATY